VLDRDALLAAGPVALQGFDLRGEGAGQLVEGLRMPSRSEARRLA